MAAYLADGNFLVALTVPEHVHHHAAVAWFNAKHGRLQLATCPVTEGTLLRFLVREGVSVSDAVAVLEHLRKQKWHRFWPDELHLERSHLVGVVGHRQITDAYLVARARHHNAKVVTFDRRLSSLHPHATELVSPA